GNNEYGPLFERSRGFDYRAARLFSRGLSFSLASPSCLLAKWQKCFLFLLFSFFCDCCHAFATLMNIA
ncbi:hypothetical protein, partial [Escherichia coli]|uniref:hypothetical protein n=1 Tax=Escherichia coli TaxID=562 RepID=UPI001BFE23BA